MFENWKKEVIDLATGVSVGGAPVWFLHFQTGVASLMMVAGIVLMYYRLRIAISEWKERKRAEANSKSVSKDSGS